ncbi:MAG: HAD family phosphatase [Anaerolineae bacterium]|nr:HAD family phosphatase [Anaerolineae bacterium]
MTRVQAVIFDMDGLMIDSERVAEAITADFLAEQGHVLTREFAASLVGLRADECAQRIIDTFDLPLNSAEMDQAMARHWRRYLDKGIPPMPGLFSLVDELEQRAIRWGVATASERWYAIRNLQNLGLAARCQAIASGDEVVCSKPAPDVYLLAAERMQADPQHCLALEDSQPGCQAAAAAGMTVAVVPNELTNSAEFTCARFRLSTLNDVIPLLDLLIDIASWPKQS